MNSKQIPNLLKVELLSKHPQWCVLVYDYLPVLTAFNGQMLRANLWPFGVYSAREQTRKTLCCGKTHFLQGVSGKIGAKNSSFKINFLSVSIQSNLLSIMMQFAEEDWRKLSIYWRPLKGKWEEWMRIKDSWNMLMSGIANFSLQCRGKFPSHSSCTSAATFVFFPCKDSVYLCMLRWQTIIFSCGSPSTKDTKDWKIFLIR